MDAIIKPFDMVLAPLFKALPSLPQNAKNVIAKIWPWAALILGVLQLFAVFSLWQAVNYVNTFATYANEIAVATGQSVNYSIGVLYYIALGVLVLDAVLLLLAVAPLFAGKRSGWNLLFLSALINLVYGVITVFDGTYGANNLIGAIIGAIVGFYLLYQVKDSFGGKSAPAKK